ncbi:MAG: transcriptional repressor [Muricomes sp.]
MSEKVRYSTKQQEIILSCLNQKKEMFCTVEEFMEYFRLEGIHIGRTTVYRALERLQTAGIVLKIPSVEGAPAQYRLVEEGTGKNYGKLLCMKCGRTIPLQCGCIDEFICHILKEHCFELDQKHTILYGYCEQCKKKSI